MRSARTSLACLSLVLLGAAGCTETRLIQVDAINNPALAATGSCSLTLSSKAPGNSLEQTESIAVISTALSRQGWNLVSPDANPAFTIEANYQLGEPRRIPVNRTDPIYGWRDNDVSFVRVAHTDANGKTTYTTHAVSSMPRQDIIGYRQSVEQVRMQDMNLTLTATRGKELLWSVNVMHASSTGDLRGMLPMLALVAAQEAGKNTHGQVERRIDPNSPDVRALRM